MARALQTWLARNAPTIGDTRVASFLRQLFPEAFLRDRTQIVPMSSHMSGLRPSRRGHGAREPIASRLMRSAS